MKTTQTANESLNVTRQQILSLVREMVAGYPNPDDAPPTFGKMSASEKGIVLKSPDGATCKPLSKGQRGRDDFDDGNLSVKFGVPPYGL